MARSDVLVSADWAQSNLDADHVVFVEVDEDTSAYDDGHIVGAVKLDWRTDLQDPSARLRRRSAILQAAFCDRGISNDDTVVLYGGNNNWFAAYAYWYFKLYGHEDVKLLDGGRKKWELESRELSPTRSDRPATSTPPGAGHDIRAFRDEVIAAIGEQNLVDVRSPDEFSGKILAPAHLPQEQSQRRPHPRRDQRAVEQGRQRGRHLQVRRRAGQALRRRRPGRRRRKRLPTAGSGNVRRTPGSSCRNCSDTRTSRTTTAVGPNTAPWWEPRSSWEADHVLCTKARTDVCRPASTWRRKR